MRELFKIIKENFILLLGTGLFTYSLFSFKSSSYRGLDIPKKIVFAWDKISEIKTFPIATYYYYDSTYLILLTVGAIFLVIGLIKLRTKKDKK